MAGREAALQPLLDALNGALAAHPRCRYIEVPVRFFSAIDKPIEVIALTGILLDDNGELLRAGVESCRSLRIRVGTLWSQKGKR